MIPYAILMMEIKLCLGETIEIRVLNPLMDGVSFRVIKNKVSAILEKSEAVTFYFLNYSNKEYKQIEVRSFEFEIIEDKEINELGATLINFHTTDEDFLKNLNILIKDYSNYITIKSEYDELEAMSYLSGVKISDTYPSNEYEWKTHQINTDVEYKQPLKPVEIAICLDSPKMWNKYLELELKEYLEFYWQENGLITHPITNYKITHIYIGNQFCPLLQPEIDIIDKCIKKVMREGLTPVLVFSTMPETLCNRYESILNELAGNIELVINDIGMLSLLKKYDKGFKITTGVLLTKRKKDSRVELPKENSKTSIDDRIYQDFLIQNLKVEKISYEVTGYPIEITRNNSILHLPMYQMNTSGHCTLKALCKNLDRSKQEYATSCPHYCEETTVLYSDNTSIIGRWNSLFGCSSKEINNIELLNSYIDKGIQRLVIRL